MTDANGNVVHAGTYVVGFYRGVLRHRGYPWYRCRHEHPSPEEARICAREGKKTIDALPSEATLPADWAVYTKDHR